MKDGLIIKLSNTFHSGQDGYYMKVTCKYREICFSWGLLTLIILLQAKLSSAEAEIKNKRQKLYEREKKPPLLLRYSQRNLMEKSESVSISRSHNESSVLGFENNSGFSYI